MRNEETMYRLITGIANEDDRILAVYMNGSRTNPNAPRDIFRDYDIVYVVKETQSFIADKAWIQKFGDIMYMQYPDEHPDFPSDKDNFYGWLMQFTDGNRIDLHVETAAHAREHIHEDRLCRIFLDKEDILPHMPEPTDEDHWVRRPTEAQFRACCNEFWWCSNNLAKGLWRKEMPYVQDMANFVVRKQLEKMLSWKVGTETDFRVSVGKSGKYMHQWLTKQEYEDYLNTYFASDIDAAWEAVFKMCGLFEQTAAYVAGRLDMTYDDAGGKAAGSFLRHVRELPEDAKEIYE